jgi:hypothetical protein
MVQVVSNETWLEGYLQKDFMQRRETKVDLNALEM